MSERGEGDWTVLKLLDWTRGHFERAGLEEARVSAEILLAHAMGCRRIELYTRFDRRPDPEELARFRELVRRAAAFEPVAYLIGRKEFYSLSFTVTPDVLIPRPETEILASEAISHLRRLGRAGRVWDVCTGSGCVAAAIASQVSDATVLATDVSPPAVAVAEENVRALALEGRVRCRVADLLKLPGDCQAMAPFDVITVNPPYVVDGDEVAAVVKHEPKVALYAGPTGLEFIRPLIAGAADCLAPGGMLAMEFGCGQGGAVRDLFAAAGRFTEPRILRDHQDIERAAVAIRVSEDSP